MKKTAVWEDRDAAATQKILTGAIKMVHNGVQKGVLWREKALHHRHLVLCRWNAARSYLAVSILWIQSSGNLEEKATVPLTIPQCSEADRVRNAQLVISETLSWSFSGSINLWWRWGTSWEEPRRCSQFSALQLQLHIPLSLLCSRIPANPLSVFWLLPLTVFPATSHFPASLPLSNMSTIALSLCIYQLSLSLTSFLYQSIHPPLRWYFGNQYFSHSPWQMRKSHMQCCQTSDWFVGCWGSSLVDIKTSWHKTMCDISSERSEVMTKTHFGLNAGMFVHSLSHTHIENYFSLKLQSTKKLENIPQMK